MRSKGAHGYTEEKQHLAKARARSHRRSIPARPAIIHPSIHPRRHEQARRHADKAENPSPGRKRWTMSPLEDEHRAKRRPTQPSTPSATGEAKSPTDRNPRRNWGESHGLESRSARRSDQRARRPKARKRIPFPKNAQIETLAPPKKKTQGNKAMEASQCWGGRRASDYLPAGAGARWRAGGLPPATGCERGAGGRVGVWGLDRSTSHDY